MTELILECNTYTPQLYETWLNSENSVDGSSTTYSIKDINLSFSVYSYDCLITSYDSTSSIDIDNTSVTKIEFGIEGYKDQYFNFLYAFSNTKEVIDSHILSQDPFNYDSTNITNICGEITNLDEYEDCIYSTCIDSTNIYECVQNNFPEYYDMFMNQDSTSFIDFDIFKENNQIPIFRIPLDTTAQTHWIDVTEVITDVNEILNRYIILYSRALNPLCYDDDQCFVSRIFWRITYD